MVYLQCLVKCLAQIRDSENVCKRKRRGLFANELVSTDFCPLKVKLSAS